MSDPLRKSRFTGWLITVMAVLAIAVLAGGYWFYRDQDQNARRAAQNQLESIAQLKVNQIAQWRAERLADAAVISSTPLVGEVVSRWLESGQAADEAQILAWFETVRDQYHYSEVTLVDPAGTPLLACGDDGETLTQTEVSAVPAAMTSGEPMLTDLYFNVDQTIHIDTIAPLFAATRGSREPLGAVVLHEPASEFLYPLVQSWPTPSETAETLLVRREGESVLFLNELRFESGTALMLSFPLTKIDLPAVMAVQGTQGLVEAPDYRGVPVLADVRPVPDSPWFMVAKIDVSEALAGTLVRSGLIFGVLGIILAAAIGGSLLVWQWGLKRRYQDAYALEAVRRELTERFEHVVRQAGDVILLADEDLRIVEANDRAVQTYGYSREELLDLRLPDMLPPDGLLAFAPRLADAEDRVSSTHEATHRRRDGSLFPVEVSDRVIRLEGRDYYQAIVRDITERKQIEQTLKESEERYRSLAAENQRLYQQQRSIAENLQLALVHVPSRLGGVRLGHLYRSATETAKVGGDFYNVFRVGDGRIAVLIGDVTGHGIEAARAAALTKDVIHAFAHQTLRPHEAVDRTNKVLLAESLPGFVTVFLGILDPEYKTLGYVSAGHPETLLRRKDGRIELLAVGSLPLGVIPEASWKTSEIQLGVGDLLLLYTDGVIEARRDGEFFGEQRLQALLKQAVSAENLPQVILDEVLDFSGGALQDDVALLSLSLGDGESDAR